MYFGSELVPSQCICWVRRLSDMGHQSWELHIALYITSRHTKGPLCVPTGNKRMAVAPVHRLLGQPYWRHHTDGVRMDIIYIPANEIQNLQNM